MGIHLSAVMYSSVGESQAQSLFWPWDRVWICVILLRGVDGYRGWRTPVGISSLGKPQSTQELRLVWTYGAPSWIPDVTGQLFLIGDNHILFSVNKE